jgi:chromate transporter
VATLGSILPSFLIILLIAMIFSGFQDNQIVQRIFKGIRPVVVALIAVPMLQMARKTNRNWIAWGVSILAAVLVAFLKVSPVYILIIVAVIAYTAAKYRENARKKEGR